MFTRSYSRLLLFIGLLLTVHAAVAADPPASKQQPTAAPAKPTASAPAAKPAEAKPTETKPAPAKPAEAKPAAPAPAAAPADETTTPLNREGARHQTINGYAKSMAGNVDLLFIGDSITQGWEGAGKDVWEKFYGPRKAMNAGIGGDRTQHVLWRLDNGNIDGISPKLAVIMIGTNNSGTNTSEQIAAGVKAIVEKLRTKLPKMKILVLAVFPRGADKNDPRRLVNEGANKLIAKLADDKTVYYLDIGPKFLEADGTLSKEIMPDLLHLSPAGYTIWAESIEDKVAELLGEKSTTTSSYGRSRLLSRLNRLLQRLR